MKNGFYPLFILCYDPLIVCRCEDKKTRIYDVNINLLLQCAIKALGTGMPRFIDALLICKWTFPYTSVEESADPRMDMNLLCFRIGLTEVEEP